MIADDLKTSIVDEGSSYIVHLDKGDVSYATWKRMHCLPWRMAIYGVMIESMVLLNKANKAIEDGSKEPLLPIIVTKTLVKETNSCPK